VLRAYGLASVELAVPVTADTVFDLASVTKTFTAMAIMTLVTDGKLSLDDPIARYIDRTPSGWAAMTVRQLLTHTSGIHSWQTTRHSSSSRRRRAMRFASPPESATSTATRTISFSA